MPRRLLNIASIVCLVACVALMGLWVRSYYACDELHGRFMDWYWFRIGTLPGRIWSEAIPKDIQFVASKVWPWSVEARPVEPWEEFWTPKAPEYTAHLGFAWAYFAGMPKLILPYWFLVLSTGSLAMLGQLRWPLRFKRRGLFSPPNKRQVH